MHSLSSIKPLAEYWKKPADSFFFTVKHKALENRHFLLQLICNVLRILNKHQTAKREKHPDTAEIKPWVYGVSDVIINDRKKEKKNQNKCSLSVSQSRFAINSILADQYL